MNSEYDLYENCFDGHFLHFFHLRMCDNFKKLIILDSHLACKLINRQFHYQHRHWFTGEKTFYSVPYYLEYYEKDKVKKIIKNDCRVLIDRL